MPPTSPLPSTMRARPSRGSALSIVAGVSAKYLRLSDASLPAWHWFKCSFSNIESLRVCSPRRRVPPAFSPPPSPLRPTATTPVTRGRGNATTPRRPARSPTRALCAPDIARDVLLAAAPEFSGVPQWNSISAGNCRRLAGFIPQFENTPQGLDMKWITGDFPRYQSADVLGTPRTPENPLIPTMGGRKFDTVL
ncbi:hypothetical protein DFH09DRAFT_1459327 [Mycena vulgaris]|nr:hypothetical protein DFH09DRAFT_1459327 [Mycena vulgaris]